MAIVARMSKCSWLLSSETSKPIIISTGNLSEASKSIPDFNKKHGVFYNKGGSCTKCHGQDLTGGIAKKAGKQVSCNDCHQSFPQYYAQWQLPLIQSCSQFLACHT